MSMPPLPEILPLTPYLREMVWGGRRLGNLYGKPLSAGQSIGESFELSALPGRDTVVADGLMAGRGLLSLHREFGAQLVGEEVSERYGSDFPLLIKLIDAHDDLSIQVHPDDAYAQSRELGVFGKTEAWVVLHSEDGRIALGLEPGVDETALRQAIGDGEAERVVRFQAVSAGDVVYLPAGTVHALCRGVLIYEVQQSSDITFRLYDYDRAGLDGEKRELHIDHGLAVTDFDAHPEPTRTPSDSSRTTLLDAEYFRLELFQGEPGVIETGASFAAVTVVEGGVTLEGSEQSHLLAIGGSAMIRAGTRVRVIPASGARCLVATPAV